jgi:hypothetical protein
MGSVGASFASHHTVNYRMHALPISGHLALPGRPCSAKAALGAAEQSGMLAELAFASLEDVLAIPRRAGVGVVPESVPEAGSDA